MIVTTFPTTFSYDIPYDHRYEAYYRNDDRNDDRSLVEWVCVTVSMLLAIHLDQCE